MANFIDKIPEFPDSYFKIVSYVCSAIIACVSVWFAYEMFTYPDFGISAQWNMFKSFLMWPLYIVGLLLALINWGKFGHWSRTPILNTYKDGRLVKSEKNYDIMEVLMWQFFFPLVGHFVLEPIIYAAIIYYPLMCIVALVGVVLPYAITLLLLLLVGGIAVGSERIMQVRAHSLILVLLTVVMAGGLGFAAKYMHSEKAGGYFYPAPEGYVSAGQDGKENTDSLSTSKSFLATPQGVDDIKIGITGGWADSVEGLYDDYNKDSQTIDDMDGSITTTFFSFKKGNEEVMRAYLGDYGKITSILLLPTANVHLKNGLFAGSTIKSLYSTIKPVWNIDFDVVKNANVTCTDAGVIYCTSSDMVKQGKDIPESLADFNDNATITQIELIGSK